MDASSQPTPNTKIILDLNYDCLLDVFYYLELDELAVVADVCTRFKQIAVDSAHSKTKSKELYLRPDSTKYSILRNFGASFKYVTVNAVPSFGKETTEYQKRLIELLCLYCVGETIKLRLCGFDITDEISTLMVPLLGRVHKLILIYCKMGKVFMNHLPLWSPEMRDLTVNAYNSYVDPNHESPQLNQLRQKCPKLEFMELLGVKNADIEEFLKQNSQLREIRWSFGGNHSDSILQLIAKYVPEIERIEFGTKMETNTINTKYFGQLRELKSLSLEVNNDRSYVPLAVHELGSANIALECLKLYSFDSSQVFIEGISKLHRLKTLNLRFVKEFTAPQLIEICEHLKELSEIWLFEVYLNMTEENLLKIIQTAKKLTKFVYRKYNHDIHDSPFDFDMNGRDCGYFYTTIGVDTMMKMERIVDERREKTPLTFVLNRAAFPPNVTFRKHNLVTYVVQ